MIMLLFFNNDQYIKNKKNKYFVTRGWQLTATIKIERLIGYKKVGTKMASLFYQRSGFNLQTLKFKLDTWLLKTNLNKGDVNRKMLKN